MDSFKPLENVEQPKKTSDTNNTNKKVFNNPEKIKEAKPTADEYLSELKIKNPEAYEKLVNTVKKFNENGIKTTLEQYIEENLKPLYLSNKQEDNNNYIKENGILKSVNYETGFTYALTDEGKLVHYSEMGEQISNYDDMKFVGYGIFWDKDNI